MRVILERILSGDSSARMRLARCSTGYGRRVDCRAQTGALLFGLRMKGEATVEIAAAAAAMRRRGVLIDAGGLPVIDTMGHRRGPPGHIQYLHGGGPGGCRRGVPIAKHGNRAMTSRCGSADVLAALGVNIEAPPELVEECLREAGMGFCSLSACTRR